MIPLSPACPLCLGEGRWIDDINQCTYICPVCRPESASSQSTSLGTPDKIPPLIPSLTFTQAKYRGGFFQHPPHTIILHSPGEGESCAEYLVCPSDGRHVSAHFAWHPDGWRQLVRCNTIAWHCRAKRMNYCSIGIELRGPVTRKRNKVEFLNIRNFVDMVKNYIPSITRVIGHYEVDPSRTDPGFDMEEF